MIIFFYLQSSKPFISININCTHLWKFLVKMMIMKKIIIKYSSPNGFWRNTKNSIWLKSIISVRCRHMCLYNRWMYVYLEIDVESTVILQYVFPANKLVQPCGRNCKNYLYIHVHTHTYIYFISCSYFELTCIHFAFTIKPEASNCERFIYWWYLEIYTPLSLSTL